MNGTQHLSRHLHLVESDAEPDASDEWRDLALLAVLLGVGVVPLVGELAGGHWGPGTLGAATGLTFLSGRELLSQLRSLLRARP